jgi:predicted acetyltransferase
MADKAQISRPGTEEELTELVRILSRAFNTSPEQSELYRRRIGDEHFRVAKRGEAVLGGLALIPKGQFFGSRSVPMTGIAAVAVSPEARGSGIATEMMRATLRELHADGVALSALYPASEPLYRKVGFEHAGGRYQMEVPLASIGIRPDDVPVREISADDPDDRMRVRAVYEHRALRNNGNLDRVQSSWESLTDPKKGAPVTGYLIGPNEDPWGYCYLRYERLPPDRFDYSVRVTDHALLNGAAGRRMLALLASHSSQGDRAILQVGPTDPLCALLPEQHYRLRLLDHWMLRIVHLPTALTARGYGPGRSAELHLDVDDELLPENTGRWVLTVESGHGRVERGGDGDLRLDANALAPLYSGQLGARTLEAMGWLQGEDEAVRKAASLFDGPAPWMNDAF